MLIFKNKVAFILCIIINLIVLGCQKTTTAPSATGVADFTVINAIPTNYAVTTVINTSQPIMWFTNAPDIYYGIEGYNYFKYSVVPGNDTVYVVQITDTLDVGPKASGQMYYGILPLNKGGIYSLFLCGKDTTSPDYLFTIDTLPYHGPNDSTAGIRFVNLSAGSNPISINLEGSANGSEVSNLGYKGITGFKDYISNSSVTYGGYIFVVRDVATGDSLTTFSLNGFGNSSGVGLSDPNTGGPLVFKNITIAFTGQPGANASVPQSMFVIDNY
jgi:hypothetical protein